MKKSQLKDPTKQEDRECPRLFLQGLIPVEKTCWCPLFSAGCKPSFAAQKIALRPYLPPRKFWFHSLTELRKLTAAFLAKDLIFGRQLENNLETEDT